MRYALIAAAIAMAVLAPACSRLSDGRPTAGPDTTAPITAPTSVPTTTSVAPPDDPDYPVPGVAVTTQPAQSCYPGTSTPVSIVAQVSDPGAPTVTLGVPDGWSMSSGGADPVGARLQGPEAMQATVTISPTTLGPEDAFRQYEDDRTSASSISTLSLLPAELCGFSGQRLIGILSDGNETVQYEDRIVHVPGPSRDFLIAVHVEAPSGTPGFDEAAAQLTADFGIGIP
ncbi:MAG: hypothetical protein AB7G47_06650 [Mycolicibacterium sp.]|uniref:hypothetical protein n=1 Tax=Mycolicibacterium sp. TaxID=2320850 RepID=UPI003D0EBE35